MVSMAVKHKLNNPACSRFNSSLFIDGVDGRSVAFKVTAREIQKVTDLSNNPRNIGGPPPSEGGGGVGREEEGEAEIEVNREISFKAIAKVVDRVKKEKTAGEDRVSIEFIKWIPKEWSLEMREIFIGFWKDARLAKGGEVARIYPIHKGPMKMIHEIIRE